MDNDQHDNGHGHPFPDGFSIAHTLQNVLRNINHALSASNPSAGPPDSQADDMPELESELDSDADTASSSAVPPIPSTSTSADVDMPSHSHTDSHPDVPDADTLEDDQSPATSSRQGPRPVGRDRGSVDDLPPLEPIAGTRRARVDDDVDDARDRRHPSERVGGTPPLTHPAPPRFPAGLFAPMFGLGNPGGNRPGAEAPPERAHAGEAAADPPPAGDNPTPDHPPRGAPFLTAGVTLTIPLFGPPPANQPGQPGGAQNGPLGGMDPATREEFFRSFAQIFQEFQAMEEGREDPERAKKLMAGLELVPLGLVKRLERVGGAPGGHVGDSTAEEASGCAICWDKLLDAESDTFIGQHSSSTDDAVGGQGETHTERNAMDVDGHPVFAPSETEASSPTPPSSEEPKIITLPCAHVFHASCLLPWFTRARQATCPTCRFNIDPENLTYTPVRPGFPRGPFRPGNFGANTAPTVPQAAPEGLPAAGTQTADAAAPVDHANTNPGANPGAPSAAPPDAAGATAGQAPGTAQPGPGFNPFLLGVPILSIPAFQIPLRPPAGQAPGGDNGNQGPDVLTIGVDMFIGGPPPPHDQGVDPGDNAEEAEGVHDDEEGPRAAGAEGATNPNIGEEFRSLMEALLRSTRDIIPQMMNAQGPPPAMDVPPADGVQPQPHAGPAPEATGPQPAPAAGGAPRTLPNFPPFFPGMFRAMRPMAPRQPKTWSLPPAPGLSLRERVELREREQGLRCSDTSCGVGPSDEDPYPDPTASLTKQVSIRPFADNNHGDDGHGTVCSHKFHPACLVSAERVAGRGEKDENDPEVEVSCPKCRASGCIAKDEWKSGEKALEAELTVLDA